MLQSERNENSCNLCPRSVLYFAGRCVQQCSVWGLVVGGAAPSVVTAHKFPTFPTCRQALPCIPTTLSVGRESPLSAPTQGDQQNFSLQVSSLADRKLQQTRAGVAIFPNQVQICFGRGNDWRGAECVLGLFWDTLRSVSVGWC